MAGARPFPSRVTQLRALGAEAPVLGKGILHIEPLDFACSMPETELTRYFTQFGPVGQVLGQAEAGLRARVIETVRPAFDPFVVGAEVRFTAACWIVSARALPASS